MSTAGGRWKVGRRGGTCEGCDTRFEPGAELTSALYLEAADGDDEASFSRRDWCATCFEDTARRGEPFSWWAARVPPPDPGKPVFDLGVAREFLVRLLREGAPEREALRYLLVLLLMRKRGVKVQEQYSDDAGTDVMVVTLPPDETAWEIPCPAIDEAEAEGIRAELGRLFDL